ncbi:hypothetical protein RFI_20739 [Reticulomyxa filosa]|uniref:Uncharacterized protein n=1 Tax=Reticulomyxa filosa TaxID=46433 RepID=X6MTZ7_RETFI|nr:hypothetical protein RFI_20739 [Reticulomyxa filosa]|eukprot:ETO16600.1 hypothetical protein RFI_20739 [Reticulomyxa filosa]
MWWSLSHLSLLQDQQIIEVVRVKNRLDPSLPSMFGYRDVLINLRFVKKGEKKEYLYNGHIVELQVHLESFQNIRKHGKGHANYSASRFLIDFVLAQQSNRQVYSDEAPEQQQRRLKIIQLIKQLEKV